MKKKAVKLLSILLAAALLIGASIGGTLAYLSAKSDTVVNTFTVGNINIKLEETDATHNNDKYEKSFKMIPGQVYLKDPVVTVEGGSEACYLFVKIDETCTVAKGTEGTYNFSDFIDYGIVGETWESVPGTTNVYYTTVDAVSGNQAFPVLKNIYTGTDKQTYANGSIIIKDTVTKEMMDAVQADLSKAPKLTFTAYAVQSANIPGNSDAEKAATAWAVAQNDGVPTNP